jgi:hypothetical protein
MFQKNKVVKLDKTMCSIYDSTKMVKSKTNDTEKPKSWFEHNFPENHRFEKVEFTPSFYFNPMEMKMAREVLQETKELILDEKYKSFSYEDLKNERLQIKARDFVRKYYPGLSHSKTEGLVKTFNKTMYKLSKFTLTLFENHSDDIKFTSLLQDVVKKKRTNTWIFSISILMQITRYENSRHEDLLVLNYENKYFDFYDSDNLSQLQLQLILFFTSKFEASHGYIKKYDIDFKKTDFLEEFWFGFDKLSKQGKVDKKSQIRKALKDLGNMDSHKKFVDFKSTNKITIIF